MGMDTDIDIAVRLAAFAWLAEQTSALGDVLPWSLLQQGFPYEHRQIPLVSPQGIYKPRILDLPLTIRTAPEGPYDDAFGADGLLSYRYRGENPNHPDNAGLRAAMRRNRPLVYLHGIVPGQYLAVWPVFIVGDDPARLSFKVAVDEVGSFARQAQTATVVGEGTEARRAYLTATVRMRLHQRAFRERVLEAYRSQCSLCQLRHRELLDAAHIIADSDLAGEPVVTNGIALCKLHHAAFDSFILGISPDYVVHVRPDVLAEHDGPLLRYGLQALHGARLMLPHAPAQWPDREALEQRYARFRGAG
jgi:putative restriction endonuclease